MTRNKFIFISDIHIGTNTPTNWYQQSVHEPFLAQALEHIRDQADSVRELIIAGDLFDFWTYLPSEVPPKLWDAANPSASIIGANPKILGDPVTGKPGLLGEAVQALQGRASFVHGNHDMTLSQEDLNEIPTGGHGIRKQKAFYKPLGNDNADIVCTHGHHFSLVCAEDHEPTNKISPLPIGYYVTRAGAYFAQQQLEQHGKANVALLPDTGEPTGADITYADYLKIFRDYEEDSLQEAIVRMIIKISNYAPDGEIKLTDTDSVTLQKAIIQYRYLQKAWEERPGLDGKPLGKTGMFEALHQADVDDNLEPFAIQVAEKYGSRVVVMGHTHVPIDIVTLGSEKAGGSFIYANSGFNCPSVPDMASPDYKKPTFIEVEVGDSEYTVTVYASSKDGVAPDPSIQPVTIPMAAAAC